MNLSLPVRPAESAKWDYGHALLIAGSYGRMGCAILAARACLRSGVGLLTVHLPERGLDPMQTAVPEAMTEIDQNPALFTSAPQHPERFQAVGIGPGIGTSDETAQALTATLERLRCPLVLDADALTILAQQGLGRLPQETVITPHEREYRRLFGDSDPAETARKHHLVIVRKSHHTTIFGPQGEQFVNTTGNPGMATAGSGDVLTGIILSFLAQGMPPFEAAARGVHYHGKSGDIAAQRRGEYSLTASDIIENLGFAMR